MSKVMTGKLPRAKELAGEVFPEMVRDHIQDSPLAPPQKGALEQETRTLIYLAVALATGSKACIENMMNKAERQNITKDKILDVFKISLYAESTRLVANAEIVFEYLNKKR